jgi:hypothetical protein
MSVGRAMNRRTFLVVDGVALTIVVFTSVAGCGEGEESSGVTMTLEPVEMEDSQQTAEILTPRGSQAQGETGQNR